MSDSMLQPVPLVKSDPAPPFDWGPVVVGAEWAVAAMLMAAMGVAAWRVWDRRGTPCERAFRVVSRGTRLTRFEKRAVGTAARTAGCEPVALLLCPAELRAWAERAAGGDVVVLRRLCDRLAPRG